MKHRFTDLLAAAAVVGIVQALVETVALGWLYRDLLLTPYRFFPIHLYDAFTKIWFLICEHSSLSLPLLLQDFVGQGPLPKLAIAPELIAINLAMAVLVALLLAPVAGLFGVGQGSRPRRALFLVLATSAVVHVLVWASAFQPPEVVTAMKLLRAIARDILQGGVAVASGVLFVSALLSSLVLRREWLTTSVVVGGLAVALVAGTMAPLHATARVASESVAAVPSPAAGYNVILISIDSLRADHLGAYGYARDTSPAMDGLASRGLKFAHHSSTTSWTLPAHMSLLTARSILGHGVVFDDRSLSPSVSTVAEAFQNGGYLTHAIVSAPYLNSRYGFARGFDDYDDRTIFFETNEDSYRSVTGPELVDAASRFLVRPHGAKPFFLFLHFWDVHYDYAPGPPYEKMFDPDYTGTVDGNNFYFDPAIREGMNLRDLQHLLALYDGEIRLVDDQIARLRAELVRLGIAGRTMIAVVADHGDEFFEHGNKGHHRTLYEEVIHTPFVLEVPGHRPSAPVVEEEVSLIDVAPTLLGLAGVKAPEGAEGRDFSGLYTGAPLPAAKPVFAELYRTGTRNVQVSETSARRKIIHHFQQRSLEVFDLDSDPGEQRSLAASGDVGGPLTARLGEWINGRWQRFDKRIRTEGIEPVVLDAKATEQLRSLGYLQ